MPASEQCSVFNELFNVVVGFDRFETEAGDQGKQVSSSRAVAED